MKKLVLTLIVTFAFCGSIFSQNYPESHWPDFHYIWGGQSGICAAIAINGHIYTVEDDGWDALEVAMFVGDDMRGRAFLDRTNVDEYGDPYPITNGTAIGYDNPNELVSFKLWNHTTSTLYEQCEVTYLDQPMVIYTGTDHFEALLDEPYLPIILNFITPTFELPITGYSNDPENPRWYLIASPIGEVNPAEVENMLYDETEEEIFDLYYFNQADPGHEWVNRVDTTGVSYFNLMPGQGYLYANKYDTVLRFTGVAYTEGVVTLTKYGDEYFKAWNLVGNPLGVDAYIDRSFYRMNAEGTEIGPETSGAIAVMEGVFVIAAAETETMTFTTEAPTEKGATLALNLTQGRAVIDRAIVSFGEGSQLPKMQLNPNHTKVYMPVEGKDYAVVNAGEMGEMPVNFKAEKNGVYTLSFSSENVSFNYLHLIDNMTGADVDLLATPSYSFEATTTDYATRFRLVFATGNSSDDNFAFYTNGSFVVSNDGNATLQVVDVMGRILTSKTINGSASVNVDAAAGVYMLRLVNGNNVKVQKVVVK